jgi:hypothetical protein
MSFLQIVDTVADVATAINTSSTNAQIAEQNQMMFDAMTPEQQQRVLAGMEARRIEAARRARKRAFIASIVVAGIIFFLGWFGSSGQQEMKATTVE